MSNHLKMRLVTKVYQVIFQCELSGEVFGVGVQPTLDDAKSLAECHAIDTEQVQMIHEDEWEWEEITNRPRPGWLHEVDMDNCYFIFESDFIYNSEGSEM